MIQGSYVRRDRPFPEVYDHPGTSRRLATLAAVATETGANAAQVVLAWLVASTPAIRPILGVSTLAQLEDLLPAGELALTRDQVERLNAAG